MRSHVRRAFFGLGLIALAAPLSVSGCGADDSQSDEATSSSDLSAPSNLHTTSVSSTSVALSWQDNSSRERGYVVERSTNSSGTGFTDVATLAPNTTTFTDTHLIPGTNYAYRVSAVDRRGVRFPSSPLQVETTPLVDASCGACPDSGGPKHDAGTDAAADVSADTGTDTGTDTGADAEAEVDGGSVYHLPPTRSTAWKPAGLDGVGGIPNYPSVTCSGLDATGSTDVTSKINACIANAAANTAVFLPAGTYRVDGSITMKSNVALRGAKAAAAPWLPDADASATTLNLAGQVSFNGGSKDTNWTPSATNGTSITAGYAQGSTSLTVSDATGYAVGDYISIYQNRDPAVIDDKGYGWLGEDCGSCSDRHVMQQYAKVAAKSGSTLTIDPAIYYVTPSHTGERIRKQTFGLVMAGIEDLRIRGNGGNYKTLFFHFTRNCWSRGVETYNAGGINSSGSPHIWIDYSYGDEFRDGYHHTGSSHDSGRNYGIEFYNWNSRHKVENNIVRDTRHSIIFEGGGSGNAVLYNYTDDNWESVQGAGTTVDTSLLSEDESANHGAHPYMNLWEGNSASDWWSDYTQGSSSHHTLFRNHVRCQRSTVPMTNPWLWVCVEIEQYNRFINVVGNVIGTSPVSGGTVVDDGSHTGSPIIYRFGYSSAGGTHQDSQSFATVIRHGNFNYVSNAVDAWATAEHALPPSMYYTSKPAFFGVCAWPPFGADRAPMTGTLPAKARYEGTSSCN
jgi:hypothetical protein